MKTKLPTGIRRRHARSCRELDGGTCNCEPSYEAWAWSAREQKKIRAKFANLAEAKSWRADAVGNIRRGKLKAPTRQTLDEEAAGWLERAAAGTALTKGSRRYKPSMVRPSPLTSVSTSAPSSATSAAQSCAGRTCNG
jgi:hypothetical protein